MKRFLYYVSFVFFVFLAAVVQVFLINSPFVLLEHIQLVLIFFIVTLLLTGEIRTLIALPFALLFLEQFTVLPFGAISISILSSLVVASLILKLLITNRSIGALSIITILTVLVYTVGIAFFSAAQNSFTESGSIIFFFKINTITFFQNVLSVWSSVLVIYTLATKYSRRWNPRYVKNRSTW